jgi:hypothetical protein
MNFGRSFGKNIQGTPENLSFQRFFLDITGFSGNRVHPTEKNTKIQKKY